MAIVDEKKIYKLFVYYQMWLYLILGQKPNLKTVFGL